MSEKILIVEDDEKNRLMLRDILRFYKYEVIEAENGEQGIKMAEEQSPDLILMDMQMPLMDGFTATKLIKNNPSTKSIKIIAVTSFAMIGDKKKILEAGADEYISKPIDTRELPKLVARMLAGKGETV